MNGKDVDVVLVVEEVAPLHHLLECVVDGAGVGLGNNTVLCLVLAVVGIGDRCAAVLVEIHGVVGCYLEAVRQADFGKCEAVEGVAFEGVGVQDSLGYGVGVAVDGTVEACVHAFAVVIHCVAIFVVHDVTVAVAYEYGIDRCYLCRSGEDVAG